MGGRYFEDLVIGELIKHQPGRTVTETDNLLFCTLTMNPQPLHLDHEFARKTQYGAPLVNGIFVLGLVVGLSVSDLTLGTILANLGYDKVEHLGPTLVGDTIYAETEVLSKRLSRSRPNAGIVEFEHRGVNQRGEVVLRCRRSGLMKCRGEGDQPA